MDEIKLVTSPNEIAHSDSVPCADWVARQPNGAVCFFVDGFVAEFSGTDGRSGSEADASSCGVPDGSAGFFSTNRFVGHDRASSGASGESGQV
jgi:hypothetical protein